MLSHLAAGTMCGGNKGVVTMGCITVLDGLKWRMQSHILGIYISVVDMFKYDSATVKHHEYQCL